MQRCLNVPNLRVRDGWYHADFIDSFGRRIRMALKTKNEMIARKLMAKLITEASEGRLGIKKPSKMFFSELAQKVLNYVSGRKKSYTTFFKPTMKNLVKFFGNLLISGITKNSILMFVEERKNIVAGATINRELAVLKRSFNLAIQWELVQSNPVKGVEFFKESRGRIRFLEKKEIEDLLECCNSYLRDIVTVAVYTGMRKGEILGLKWGNIDLRRKLIVLEQTKNDEIREIPMAELVYNIMLVKFKEDVRDGNDYVFVKPNGEPYYGVRKAFDHALKSAAIKDFRFHDLRHTFASHLVMSGVDIVTVQRLLGHKDIKMTLRYSHLAPEHKRQAIEKLSGYLNAEEVVDTLNNRFDSDIKSFSCHKNVTNGVLAESQEKALVKSA